MTCRPTADLKGIMEDAIKTATVLWDYVTKMPEHLLLILVLNVIGMLLKRTPGVPNKMIPALLVLLGACLYPMIGKPGQISPELRNPTAMLAIYGVLLGFAAWLIHVAVLKNHAHYIRKVPLVGDMIADALDLEELEPPKP